MGNNWSGAQSGAAGEGRKTEGIPSFKWPAWGLIRAMTGYPPRRPFRPVSFCFGILAGLGIAVVAMLAIWIMNLDGKAEHGVLAVSWSPARDGGSLIYQAVVSAKAENGGPYRVSARINIGSDNYHRDVGTLGTARSVEEALKNYGTIRWLPEAVTFGSETVIAAAVNRAELEKHR